MTIPSVQVLLDNFAAPGTFPFDITQYVELTETITASRGRPDEFQQASAGVLSLTVDNTDGRFTLGSATYGIGLDQQIRLKLNGANLWTGYVQEWPVAWPGGGQEYATVRVTATDAFARIARGPLRSALEEEVLADSPTVYYTLGEPNGATTGGDSSGNGGPPLAAAGTGSPVVFGNGTGPTDGLTAVQMSGGKYLSGTSATPLLGNGGTWTLEAWFATPSAPPTRPMRLVNVSGVDMELTTAGKLSTVGFLSPSVVTDGGTHHAVVTWDGSLNVTVYLDGASLGTGLPTGIGAVSQTLSVGGPDQSGIDSYTGTVSHVATYATQLSAGRVAVHYVAGSTDFAGENPASRFARVASYCGVPSTGLDAGGSTVLGAATQGGRDALDVLNEVAEATLGFVMLNGSGQVTSINGASVVTDLTPDATLDAQWADPGTQVQADKAFLINEVTGGSTSSQNTSTARNATSVGVHGLYHEDFTWNVNTDDQATDRSNWIVGTYSGPSIRFPSLTFDVLTMDAGNTTQALALDVGRFLHVTGFPSQAGGAIQDLIVQGITWTIGIDAFTVEVNCAPRANYSAWILNDNVWGVLGSTTKLYGA